MLIWFSSENKTQSSLGGFLPHFITIINQLNDVGPSVDLSLLPSLCLCVYDTAIRVMGQNRTPVISTRILGEKGEEKDAISQDVLQNFIISD